MTARTLSLSYGISRGRETDGYTIVRLTDSETGKRYRCMGGGYDMVGTVLAEWLQDVHQDELQAIGSQAYYVLPDRTGRDTGLYGMSLFPDGHVTLDGATGISSVLAIADAAGVKLDRMHDRKGNTTGWVVLES